MALGDMSINQAKTIDQPGLDGAVAQRQGIRRAEVRIARGFDDLLMVYSVRSAVYIAEQECPFAEEFDGNDHCATHLIGFIEGEPAGCIRARFFHDFAKLERLAVLKKFRKSRLADELVLAGIDLCAARASGESMGLRAKDLRDFGRALARNQWETIGSSLSRASTTRKCCLKWSPARVRSRSTAAAT
jgi:predicted GNAT family N-acyltransferase